MNYISHYLSPLGAITLASDGTSLTGLWFDGQKYFGSNLEANAEEAELPVFDTTRRWLDTYFSGVTPDFMPPLNPGGTVFRQQVWKVLLSIPYGTTVTYGDIAVKIAEEKGEESMSSQAVGGAVGHNPISIIVPCHRVMGAGNSLTGYAGGVDKKRRLLELEGIDTSVFKVPVKGTAL